MRAMTNRRDPTVLIRAWFEDGSSAPLRSNIRFADEHSNGFGKSTRVTTPEAATKVVRVWLEHLVAERSDDLSEGKAQ